MIKNRKDLYEFLKSYGAWESASRDIYKEYFPLTLEESNELLKLDNEINYQTEYSLYAGRHKKIYVCEWGERELKEFSKEFQEKLFEILSRRLMNKNEVSESN